MTSQLKLKYEAHHDAQLKIYIHHQVAFLREAIKINDKKLFANIYDDTQNSFDNFENPDVKPLIDLTLDILKHKKQPWFNALFYYESRQEDSWEHFKEDCLAYKLIVKYDLAGAFRYMVDAFFDLPIIDIIEHMMTSNSIQCFDVALKRYHTKYLHRFFYACMKGGNLDFLKMCQPYVANKRFGSYYCAPLTKDNLQCLHWMYEVGLVDSDSYFLFEDIDQNAPEEVMKFLIETVKIPFDLSMIWTDNIACLTYLFSKFVNDINSPISRLDFLQKVWENFRERYMYSDDPHKMELLQFLLQRGYYMQIPIIVLGPHYTKTISDRFFLREKEPKFYYYDKFWREFFVQNKKHFRKNAEACITKCEARLSKLLGEIDKVCGEVLCKDVVGIVKEYF